MDILKIKETCIKNIEDISKNNNLLKDSYYITILTILKENIKNNVGIYDSLYDYEYCFKNKNAQGCDPKIIYDVLNFFKSNEIKILKELENKTWHFHIKECIILVDNLENKLKNYYNNKGINYQDNNLDTKLRTLILYVSNNISPNERIDLDGEFGKDFYYFITEILKDEDIIRLHLKGDNELILNLKELVEKIKNFKNPVLLKEPY